MNSPSILMRPAGFSTVVVLFSEQDKVGLLYFLLVALCWGPRQKGLGAPRCKAALCVLTSSSLFLCLSYSHHPGSQTLEQKIHFLFQSRGGKRCWVYGLGEQCWSNRGVAVGQRLLVHPPQQCRSGTVAASYRSSSQIHRAICDNEGGGAGTHPGRTTPSSEMS